MKVVLAGAFSLFVLWLAPTVASAALIPVNTTADEYGAGSGCSLREAITAAQDNVSFGGCPAGFGSDTIGLPGGRYRITRVGDEEDLNSTGDFDITGANPLDIQAAGPEDRVTVDGNGLDRVFDQHSSAALKLLALRVTGGKLTATEDGGGIRNVTGVLYLDNVTVDGNSSTVSAGGIAGYTNVQIVNSTISGNKSRGDGGGIFVPGGASLVARSSTIYGNQADSDDDGNGFGGGFAELGGLNVSFTNVINAGNSGTAPLPANDAYDCYSGPNFYPRFTLSGQPMGPLDCLVGFNPGTNLVSNNTKVDAVLRYNGGQTPTHNLLPGSPAIGAGGTTAPDECPGIDQNGIGRPAGQCDIGAVQFVPVPGLVITKLRPKKKVIRRKRSKPIAVELRNDGTGPAQQVKVCLKLNKAARKGLRIKGKACKNLGTIALDQIKRAKVRLAAKAKARKKAYRVKATVKATGIAKLTRTFKVRVK